MKKLSRQTRNKKRSQTKSSGGRTVIQYRLKKTTTQCYSNCGQTISALRLVSPKTNLPFKKELDL